MGRAVIATFISEFIVRWAKQIMIGLGFSYISYTAISTLITQISSTVLTNYSGLPATAFQLANYAGVHESLSIVLAAFATGAVFDGYKRLRIKA